MEKDLLENSSTYELNYTVQVREHGKRLDMFLAHRLQVKSRSSLQKTIKNGRVFVLREGHSIGRIKSSLRLLYKDSVIVLSLKKKEPPVCFAFETIYEDQHVWVINKPPCLPVHPAGSYFFHTLLIYIEKTLLKKIYLPHRIDKDTSGILVLAKTKESCAFLTKQFALRSIKKKYFAITHGHPPDSFTVKQPIREAINSLIGLKMECHPEGLSAVTLFYTKEKFYNLQKQPFSLVECAPITGRQHQIRVHLAFMGFPIVGDKLYALSEQEALEYYDRKILSAATKQKLLLPRHALHASEISFQHPEFLKMYNFHAPLAADLQNFCAQLQETFDSC